MNDPKFLLRLAETIDALELDPPRWFSVPGLDPNVGGRLRRIAERLESETSDHYGHISLPEGEPDA
jgi:hypothetical protein